MKFDVHNLQNASMPQLAQALIERLGPLADSGITPGESMGEPMIEALRECLSIAMQIDGRLRGREQPDPEGTL